MITTSLGCRRGPRLCRSHPSNRFMAIAPSLGTKCDWPTYADGSGHGDILAVVVVGRLVYKSPMAFDTEQDKRAIFKATVLAAGDTTTTSASSEEQGLFESLDALGAPHDPAALCHTFEHSNSLRQTVDAYATNIDGFGHRLECTINFDAENADAEVAKSLRLEAMAKGEPCPKLTRRDIAHHRRELEDLAEAERARLDAFFDTCCLDHSFVELRRRTRQDLEVTGNAYWEVVRNAGGQIARLVHVPSHTVRLLPLAETPVEVPEKTRISAASYQETSTLRRPRGYVQRQGLKAVYFKSLGDPRVIGRAASMAYPDVETQHRQRPDDRLASEMVHFAIHSPHSPYGVPRWIGSLLSVLGSRQMEEVNYQYFANKSVPPLALLVSGGKLSESSIPRLQSYIEDNIKGTKNFHKMLIIEAEGASGTDATKTKVELKPLTNAQQQDALFQKYDERNMDKVGAAFRLPRLLRGESKDFNRSVADAQLRFCEDQVFQPERAEFDYFINHRLLPDMGIRMWRFKSQSPVTRDPERVTDSIERLVRVGVLTPEEGRVLASDVFNKDFRVIGDDWVKRPLTLTLAGIQTGVADVSQPIAKSRLQGKARELLELRAELETYEREQASEMLGKARDAI